MTSEGWLRINGESSGGGFAPLSRFWSTADGWIRAHANYPWHRAALIRKLELAPGAGPDEVASAPGREHPDRRRAGPPHTRDRHPERSLAGTRVVDLTMVIAGPVATRFLAAAGAEVLRLDSPYRPELPIHRYDGLPGKRSALLDVGTSSGLDRLHELVRRFAGAASRSGGPSSSRPRWISSASSSSAPARSGARCPTNPTPMAPLAPLAPRP